MEGRPPPGLGLGPPWGRSSGSTLGGRGSLGRYGPGLALSGQGWYSEAWSLIARVGRQEKVGRMGKSGAYC